MLHQVPSLEYEGITSLLRHSNYVKAALQQVMPQRLRVQITRRVIIDGKVTAMRAALNTWPEGMMAVGDFCCRDRLLFDHGRGAEVDDVLPQMLQFSLGRVQPPPPPTDPEGVPLSIAFICARFLEMTLSSRPGKLRHLDLTYYGMLNLPDLNPILDALHEILSADAAEGRVFLEPFTLSVGIAVSTVQYRPDQLDTAAVQLGRLLEKQAGRPVRCVLRITGLLSGEVGLQKRARRMLRLLAQHNCPLEVLVTNGTSDWGKGEQAALVKRFSNLRVLGSGACEALVRPRPRPPPAPPAPGDSTEVPRQYNVRSLVLSGCKPGLARRLKTACLPSGWLRSLSVSGSLLGLFALEELRHLHRLSILCGHGPAEARPHRMDQFLLDLPQLEALQLLSIDDLLTDSQVRQLAAALPALQELRFCRLPTALAHPLGVLVALCAGARLAPLLTALHVKLEREPLLELEREPLPAGDQTFLQLAESLRRRLGQPQRENLSFYLTEMALQGSDQLDQLQVVPL